MQAPAVRPVRALSNDANPCSLAQPCRGFARALTQTNAGGEVVVVDSAGYGPVSIAKSISLVAPSGVYAGVSVTSGTGITVAGSIASRNTIIRNTTGVQANATMAFGQVVLDANLISLNGTAVSVDFESGGYTFGNNSYAANMSDGSSLIPLSVK